jgi:hypothetical protein
MSKHPKPSPAPAREPVRFSIGVVAHNEGTRPDGSCRLRAWLDHWRTVPNIAEMVIILHDCVDDSAAICEEYGIRPHTVNVAGLIESILWETVPRALPDCWHLRLGGIDEFVTAAHMERIAGVIRANEGVRLYYVARRNYCDGVDISDLLGPDWQVDLMLPQPPPIDFTGGMHAYPKILLHGSAVGMIDPQVAYIAHNRTYAEIERCNRARDGFASVETIREQEGFIQAVRKRLGKAAP